MSKKRRSRKSRTRRNPISNLGSHAKKRRSRSRALSSARPAQRSTSTRRRRRGSFIGSVKRRVSRAASSDIGSFVTNSLVPAAVGAAGAVGVDMAWNLLPIPDSLKTGPLAPITRIVGAVAVGMAVGAVMGKKFGREATLGAVTVTLADLGKGYLKNNTSLPLSYYAPPRARALSYYAPQGGYASEDEINPEGYAWDTLRYA